MLINLRYCWNNSYYELTIGYRRPRSVGNNQSCIGDPEAELEESLLPSYSMDI